MGFYLNKKNIQYLQYLVLLQFTLITVMKMKAALLIVLLLVAVEMDTTFALPADVCKKVCSGRKNPTACVERCVKIPNQKPQPAASSAGKPSSTAYKSKGFK